MGCAPESQVRNRRSAGGRRIRTLGPPPRETTLRETASLWRRKRDANPRPGSRKSRPLRPKRNAEAVQPQPAEYAVGRQRLDFIFKPRPTNSRSSGRIKWCSMAALLIYRRDEFLDEIKPACQRVARCRPESPTA